MIIVEPSKGNRVRKGEQGVCCDTLPWLISFSLDVYAATNSRLPFHKYLFPTWLLVIRVLLKERFHLSPERFNTRATHIQCCPR
jgi:hypothetical protein